MSALSLSQDVTETAMPSTKAMQEYILSLNGKAQCLDICITSIATLLAQARLRQAVQRMIDSTKGHKIPGTSLARLPPFIRYVSGIKRKRMSKQDIKKQDDIVEHFKEVDFNVAMIIGVSCDIDEVKDFDEHMFIAMTDFGPKLVGHYQLKEYLLQEDTLKTILKATSESNMEYWKPTLLELKKNWVLKLFNQVLDDKPSFDNGDQSVDGLATVEHQINDPEFAEVPTCNERLTNKRSFDEDDERNEGSSMEPLTKAPRMVPSDDQSKETGETDTQPIKALVGNVYTVDLEYLSLVWTSIQPHIRRVYLSNMTNVPESCFTVWVEPSFGANFATHPAVKRIHSM